MYKQLIFRFDEIKKNILGLQGMSGGGSAAAAAAAANAAQFMQFNPLLYSYQLQMAHQALGSKKSCTYLSIWIN